MKALSSVSVFAWLLASRIPSISGHLPPTRTSVPGLRAGTIDVRRNVPKLPWAISPTIATTVEQPTTPRTKAKLKMGVEVLLQGALASEFISRMAIFLRVDPSAVLLAANFGVHAVWQLATWKKHDLRAFMHRHFLLRSDDLDNERVHTILLSGFSHQGKEHFAANMGRLLLLGPQVSKQLGSRLFSYFYIAAIYASDLFDQFIYSANSKYITVNLPFWKLKLPKNSLGASGAVSSLLCYYCLKFPMQVLSMTIVEEFEAKFLNKTVTPADKKQVQEVPAMAIGVVALISDLFPAPGSSIGHGAHLGGHLFGACFFLAPRLCRLIRKYYIRRKERSSFSWKGFQKGLAGTLQRVGAFAKDVMAELRKYLSSRMEEFCNQMAAQSALKSSPINQAMMGSAPSVWDLQDHDQTVLRPLDDFDAPRDWSVSTGVKPRKLADKREADIDRFVSPFDKNQS